MEGDAPTTFEDLFEQVKREGAWSITKNTINC